MAKWGSIRNKLENEYLAHSLRGHIQYVAVSYSKSHDHEGRFAVRYDGKEIFKSDGFKWRWEYFENYYSNLEKNKDMSHNELWKTSYNETIKDGAFDQHCFYKAFEEFDNQSIEKSLNSENAIVRMLSLLDRRTGKRRLVSMKDRMENEPDWIKLFYRLRINAEKIQICG